MAKTNKTIIARVKPSDSIKIVLLVTLLVVACILTITQYVMEEKTSSRYYVATIALGMVIYGIWMVVRIIQRTFISGIIIVDSRSLYMGQRKIAWKKIAKIFTTQKAKETYLVVTTEDIPAGKILVFEADVEPTKVSDSLAYRLNLSNFNLSSDKIEQILNEKLKKYRKS